MIRSIGANWIQLIVGIAVASYLTPFTLRHLGQAEYGTWLLITSLTGYLGLLVLGLPMASVRFIARHANDRDPTELNRAIANCIGICAVLGGVAIVAGIVAYGFFTRYAIPPALLTPARMAFLIIVANTAAGFVGQLPIGILAAHEAFVVQNKILLVSLLVRSTLTVSLLLLHPSLVVLAVTLSVSVVVEAVWGGIVVHLRYPHIRPRLADVNWATTRSIFGFSLYVLLLAVGAQLSFQTDALVVGKMIGVASIPLFSTASLIAIYLMQLVIGIAAVLMPTATRLHATQGVAPLRDVFLKWSKACFSLTLLASVYLLIWGPDFLAWWLGPEFRGPAGQVLRILTIGNIVFLPARGVAQPILMGIGNPRVPALGFITAGIANLILSVALAPRFGLAGVAIGTVIPNVVLAAFLVGEVCRTLGIRMGEYIGYVLPLPLLGAGTVLALAGLAAQAIDTTHFPGLFESGLITLVLFAVTWTVLVYRGDRYVDLLGMARTWVRAEE